MMPGRLPPAGEPVSAAGLRALLASSDAAERLEAGLSRLLGGAAFQLFASGREALRAALAHLAARSGRAEVVIAGYTCWSLPAAAVAAGLRVRLVDVDERGAIDLADLARLPLERAAALVVSNLYGVPEAVAAVAALAAAAGTALVDDAAQSLAARGSEGAVGARGDVGLLSFARGKPLSALGGGALAWRETPPGLAAPARPRAAGAQALARALAWNTALAPPFFAALRRLPGLHVGETLYDPAFARGGISGAALALSAALVEDVAEAGARRADRAETLARALGAATRLEPILAQPPAQGVYPRLALRARDASARRRALAAAAEFGASASYPDSLDRLAALAPHLAESRALAGARDLAERVFTLPTHAAAARRADALVRALAEAE